MFNVENENLIEETTKVTEINGLFGINELIESYVNAESAQAAENLNKFFDLIKLCYTDNSFKNRPAVSTDGKSIKPCCYIWLEMKGQSFEVLDRQGKKIVLGENSAMAEKKITFTVLENEKFTTLQEKFKASLMNIEDIQRDNGDVEILIYPDKLIEEVEDIKAKLTATYDIKVAEKAKAIAARNQRNDQIKQQMEEQEQVERTES